MISRFSVTKKSSTEKASDGTYYPDIMTFPVEKFTYKDPPREYYITQGDIERPDLLMMKVYGTPQYDDLVAWLNNLPSFREAGIGDKILLPSKADLEKFFIKYKV